ncbi:MAG: flagellar protein FliT [Cyanobacteria bacterium REEB65]|nr:flagellar protein FliT [Cyanobacteria bacterium REEB65]
MSAELIEIYQKTLDLTFRQRMAVKESRWDDLITLGEERTRQLEAAQQLLEAKGPPPNCEEAHRLLEQIHEHNMTNQRILQTKRDALAKRMNVVRQGQRVLSGYGAALGGLPAMATLVDRAR